MKAVIIDNNQKPNELRIGEIPTPQINENEVLIRVKATALNRADLLQRRGMYPPPKGESEILGLEAAGVVVEVGKNVNNVAVGDRVCCLLPGGGYAEYVGVPSEMVIQIPNNLSYEEAAGIPEAFLTAYLNIFELGRVKKHDKVLVHAGASGVGTAAIQLLYEAGTEVFITAGSDEKINFCIELGAKYGWNYKNGSFLQWIKENTENKGVNIILDFVGAPYFQENLQSLATDGRLIVIGAMGGANVDTLDLRYLLRNRLQIIGTALRSKTVEEKIKLTKEFKKFALERFEDGRLKPIIDRVFDWKNVEEAHNYMESNLNIGKIILKITEI